MRSVLGAMQEVGVDLCVDVHGDEELPFVFFAGNEGACPPPRLGGAEDSQAGGAGWGGG
jgi:hypothetical protein